ncbi:aminotransferase class V-fold PLP-dependent enzyme [Massilia forsythiae]|uniref:cysteine desulfurase n=1 Tax=Massilia forsythiae TaxID=2728020 RepID=A0A7Z2VVL5_9BURK|nr:aminotransferase class V-fold PLP-dependent enzyme [Massilia forsythiae]QJD99734.1 aminotransferase class V-fold PLP-dependent enzyme [Massilia forsythiae]
MQDIYLDANATSPVLPAAIDAAIDAMASCFGNPSSSHAGGLRARRILDSARERARRVLGAPFGRVLFNSGATEGIQTAVLSALCALRERRLAGEACGELLLYGATEHKAVPESLAHWNRVLGAGLALQAIPVGADGRHDLAALRELAPRAAMVCTMAANNETGAVSDLDGIARVLEESGSRALWMVDCVQALGKLPLALSAGRIDYAPFSGHKLHAPKGIGMLYVREGAPFTPLLTGGGQEAAQRSGTENMAGIAALGAVLAALEEGSTFRSHAAMAAMRARLVQALRKAFPGIVFNTPDEHALPTTLNFAVAGMQSRDLLDLFDAAGVRVSAGSACSAAKAAPSYVLEAMGLPPWRSSGAVRLSFGPLADDAFIDAACARIRRCGQVAQAAAHGAALAPSSLSGQRHGVLQLSGEGRHGWLLFDHDAGACVAIDAPAGQEARIAGLVRGAGLRVAAVLGTADDAAGRAGRAALRAALGLDASAGPFGWPEESAAVALADGRRVPCIALGAQVLARVDRGDAGPGAAQAAGIDGSAGTGRTCYLLGSAQRDVDAGKDRLPAAALRMAFVGLGGAAALDGIGPARAMDGVIVCHGADAGGSACTRLAAAAASAASAAAPDCRPAAAEGATGDPAPPALQPVDLAAFLARHGDALLIDVREAIESEAGAATLYGRRASALPLSRLAEHLHHLLAAPQRPLVLFCRSGNRSARAALCLQRAGHANAWTLVGGIALADDC